MLPKVQTFSRQDARRLFDSVKMDFAKEAKTILILGRTGSDLESLLKGCKEQTQEVYFYDEKADTSKIAEELRDVFDKKIVIGYFDDPKRVRAKIRADRVYFVTATPKEILTEYKNRSLDKRRSDSDEYNAKSLISESTIAYEQKEFIKKLQ